MKGNNTITELINYYAGVKRNSQKGKSLYQMTRSGKKPEILITTAIVLTCYSHFKKKCELIRFFYNALNL